MRGQVNFGDDGLTGREGARGAENNLAFCREKNSCVGKCLRDCNAKTQFPARNFQADGGVKVRVLWRTDPLNRIPILTPRLCFAGLKKAEVGLVVGVNSGHDFDVWTELAFRVALGEIAIPRVAELVVAPSPLFLTGRDMVIGNMDDTRLRLVIVTAEEIFLTAHAHVGRGHRNVGVERKVVGLVLNFRRAIPISVS